MSLPSIQFQCEVTQIVRDDPAPGFNFGAAAPIYRQLPMTSYISPVSEISAAPPAAMTAFRGEDTWGWFRPNDPTDPLYGSVGGVGQVGLYRILINVRARASAACFLYLHPTYDTLSIPLDLPTGQVRRFIFSDVAYLDSTRPADVVWSEDEGAYNVPSALGFSIGTGEASVASDLTLDMFSVTAKFTPLTG